MQSQPTPRVTAADVLVCLYQRRQTSGAYTPLPALATALNCTEAEVQRLVKQLEDDGYALVQGGADALVVGITYDGTRQARKEMALPALLALGETESDTVSNAVQIIFRDAEIQQAQLARVAHRLVTITRQELPHAQAEAYEGAVMALLQPGPRRDPAALRAEMTKLALLDDIPGTPQQMLAVWPVLYQLLLLLAP